MKIRSKIPLIFFSEKNIRGIIVREVIGFNVKKRYTSNIIEVESQCFDKNNQNIGGIKRDAYNYDFQKVDIFNTLVWINQRDYQ